MWKFSNIAERSQSFHISRQTNYSFSSNFRFNVWRFNKNVNDVSRIIIEKLFFFESQCQYDLKYENDVYAHVVNNNFSKILIRNVINKSITLSKHVKLNTITKYNQIDCYLIMSKRFHKTINEWMIDRSWKKQIIVDFVIVTTIYVVFTQLISSTSIDLINTISLFISLITSTISQINFKLKHVFSNDVIVYNFDVINMIKLIENFQNVFHDIEITINISKKINVN